MIELAVVMSIDPFGDGCIVKDKETVALISRVKTLSDEYEKRLRNAFSAKLKCMMDARKTSFSNWIERHLTVCASLDELMESYSEWVYWGTRTFPILSSSAIEAFICTLEEKDMEIKDILSPVVTSDKEERELGVLMQRLEAERIRLASDLQEASLVDHYANRVFACAVIMEEGDIDLAKSLAIELIEELTIHLSIPVSVFQSAPRAG